MNLYELSKGRRLWRGCSRRMRRSTPRRSGVFEQCQLERVAGAGRLFGIICQRHRAQARARHRGCRFLHEHPVFGQRAGLVRSDHRHRTERLDGAQAPHDGFSFGHALDAQRQRQRQIPPGGPSGTAATASATAKRKTWPKRPIPSTSSPPTAISTDQMSTTRAICPPNFFEPAFERRLFRLDAADHDRQPAHRALCARAADLDVALAAHEQRPAEDLALMLLSTGTDSPVSTDSSTITPSASIRCRQPECGRRPRCARDRQGRDRRSTDARAFHHASPRPAARPALSTARAPLRICSPDRRPDRR